MITCPICNSLNINLDVICKSCGSYLQPKIENINLFEILWLLFEDPKKGLKTVAIARHKNFLLFFSALFGISLMYLIFEILKIYDHWDKPILILVAGALSGIPLGFLTLVFLSLLTLITGKIFKLIKINFKQIYTTITFSTTPFIYILFFLFPVKLITYGIHIFSINPSPMVINPTVYWIILILTGVFLIYFLFLMIISMNILFEVKSLRAFFLIFIIISTVSIGYFFLLNYIQHHILSI